MNTICETCDAVPHRFLRGRVCGETPYECEKSKYAIMAANENTVYLHCWCGKWYLHCWCGKWYADNGHGKGKNRCPYCGDTKINDDTLAEL
jgi:hypothetical protein